MLMKGDLVRIPQNTRATRFKSDSWVLTVVHKPEIGIVLKINENKCTVLFDEDEWVVQMKDLQLLGNKNVH